MKEVPGDPAALKRAAKNKRKQKEAATEESGTNVRSMMTGVTEMIGRFCTFSIFRAINSLTWTL